MGEINNILDDQSNNDYQLVKELSIYVKNHKNNRLTIDKKFVQDVIDIIMQNSQIDFSKVITTNNQNFAGEYDQDLKAILINVKKLYKGANNLNRKFFEPNNMIVDKDIIKYYYSLGLIIHEVTHARQYHVIPEAKNNIYSACYKLCIENESVYDKYYDRILFERYANLRGFTIAYKVLSYIYPHKYIGILRYHIYAYLLYGYTANNGWKTEHLIKSHNLNKNTKILSAIENHNAIMEENSFNKSQIKSNDDMTLYDRLYLGLPLSLQECQKVLRARKEIGLKTEDVQKIINNL